MQKSDLRKRIKENKISDLYIKNASLEISKRVLSLPEFSAAKTVFVYVSTKCEPQTDIIIKEALKTGKTVCIPKCKDKGDMVAVKTDDLSKLKTGAFGIMEPCSFSNIIEKESIDLAVIPCVAADKKGNRLGHGGGYYDRFLKGTKLKKVCICFEKNCLDFIPSDTDDVLMDYTVTENGIY